MERLTEIYNDLHNLGVTVRKGSYGLSGRCDSATVKLGSCFGVFMDTDRIHNSAQELDSASHEWAHIVSDATYGATAPQEIVMKAETRATRTQIERVLPFAEMQQAMKDGYTTSYALAGYFGITEELIQKAYDYYTGPCGLAFG